MLNILIVGWSIFEYLVWAIGPTSMIKTWFVLSWFYFLFDLFSIWHSVTNIRNNYKTVMASTKVVSKFVVVYLDCLQLCLYVFPPYSFNSPVASLDLTDAVPARSKWWFVGQSLTLLVLANRAICTRKFPNISMKRTQTYQNNTIYKENNLTK